MKNKVLFAIATIFSILACVDPFDPGLVGKDRKLVVEALLTNRTNYVKVQLSFSAGYNATESIFARFARNATVSIVDDRGTVMPFVEENTGVGLYVSSRPIKADFARTYTLVIKIDNKEYRSNAEKMVPVAEISQVTTQYEKNTDPRPKAVGRFDLFVDTKDPAGRTDFYRWDWKHYKRPQYCRTQRGAVQGETPPPIIGFKCCEDCWDVTICNGCINIASDQFANGAVIARQQIGAVDYDSREPYYIVVEQQSLTREAYEFWKSVRDQTANSGGVFDTPPAAIKGNIKNIADASEQVLGFFGVSAIASKAFYLERNVPGIDPFEKVVAPRGQPSEISGDCFECREGSLRTGIKPEGWFDLTPPNIDRR